MDDEAFIRRIWQIPWEMWQSRNNHEHGAKDQEKMIQQLKDEVQTQIDIGTTGIPELEQFFQDNELEKILFVGTLLMLGLGSVMFERAVDGIYFEGEQIWKWIECNCLCAIILEYDRVHVV